MTVRTLSYRDLTPDQRLAGAAKMRGRLMGALGHPFITIDQRQAIYDKIALIDRWERLEIDILPPQPARLEAAPTPVAALPQHTPQHHTVDVTETVPTDDKL